MKRRDFITKGTIISSGTILFGQAPVTANPIFSRKTGVKATDLFSTFKTPELKYHPFVRWWWNGNKIEKDELIRELHLLKDAGIGGVEINPIEFPSRIEGDDLGIKSSQWLSDEWIEMLQITFAEAKKLGISSYSCDNRRS